MPVSKVRDAKTMKDINAKIPEGVDIDDFIVEYVSNYEKYKKGSYATPSPMGMHYSINEIISNLRKHQNEEQTEGCDIEWA